MLITSQLWTLFGSNFSNTTFSEASFEYHFLIPSLSKSTSFINVLIKFLLQFYSNFFHRDLQLYIVTPEFNQSFQKKYDCCPHSTQTSDCSSYFATKSFDACNITFLLARENDCYVFLKYIHMSPKQYDIILLLIWPKIEKQCKHHPLISTEKQLAA